MSHEDNTLHNHLVKNGIIKQAENGNNSNVQFQHYQNINQQQQQSSNQHAQTPTTMPLPLTQQNQSSWIFRQNLIHRKKVNVFRPMITWFVRFFAGIIHQNFVIRYE